MPLSTDWDEDFKPEDPFAGGTAEELVDGNYEFLITSAKQKEAKGKTILELKMEVLTPGKHQGVEISNALWLSDSDAAKRVGYVLKLLGFDVDNWLTKNNRPFSQEFPKSVRWLVGMKVKAKKTTTIKEPQYAKDVAKTYHNINIKGRCAGGDAQPAKIGQAELDQPDPNAEEDPFAASE